MLIGNLLTTHKGHCAQCLLHKDLGDRRQVVMGVVRHHNSRKQDRHYSCKWRETGGRRTSEERSNILNY